MAQYELARAYTLGEGVGPDVRRGRRAWYTAAAECGTAFGAVASWGSAYRDGRGVAQPTPCARTRG